MMRPVRNPNLGLFERAEVLKDLQTVLADVTHALNTAEDIEVVAVGGEEDGAAVGGSGLTHPQVMSRASLNP